MMEETRLFDKKFLCTLKNLFNFVMFVLMEDFVVQYSEQNNVITILHASGWFGPNFNKGINW